MNHSFSKEIQSSHNFTSTEEIEEYLVEGAQSVIPDSEVVLYRYDRNEPTLRPAVATPMIASLVSKLPSLGMDSETWQAFIDEETTVFESFDEITLLDGAQQGPLRAIVVPIAEFGVMICCSTEETYSDTDIHIAELLAERTKYACDQLVYENTLETYTNSTIPRLEQIRDTTELLWRIQRTVVKADTTEELEITLCEEIANNPDVSTVAFARSEMFDQETDGWTWAGDTPDYLDTVYHLSRMENEPTFQVSNDPTQPVLVENVAELAQSAEWAKLAIESGITGVVSVPIVFEDLFFGVLSIYLSNSIDLNSTIQKFIEEGKQLISYGFAATTKTQSLVSNHGIELELATTDSNCLNHRIALESNCDLIFESVVSRANKAALAYVRITDGSIEDLYELIDNSGVVRDITHIGDTQTGTLAEIDLANAPIELEIANIGVKPIQVTASPEQTTILVRLAPTQSVRPVLATLQRKHTDITLKSQRRTNPGTVTATSTTLLDTLSSRQQEILEAAVQAGYFDSPRGTDGEELADKFGMAPSTFYEHIRAAQRNLFSTVFDEDSE